MTDKLECCVPQYCGVVSNLNKQIFQRTIIEIETGRSLFHKEGNTCNTMQNKSTAGQTLKAILVFLSELEPQN